MDGVHVRTFTTGVEQWRGQNRDALDMTVFGSISPVMFHWARVWCEAAACILSPPIMAVSLMYLLGCNSVRVI